MLTVETPQDPKQHAGREMGVSEWVTVDQDMIHKFAKATGDHQCIHVDVERAKRERSISNTIAHGYPTLSLVLRLGTQIMKVEKTRRGVNHGSNKARFTGMAPASSRVRRRSTLGASGGCEGRRRAHHLGRTGGNG